MSCVYTAFIIIEIYKSINNLNPQIMKKIFDLKNTRYDLRNKQLLKLLEISTSRYSTQSLCFKGSLYGIWFQVNLKTLTVLRILRNTLKNGKLLPAAVNCISSYIVILVSVIF